MSVRNIIILVLAVIAAIILLKFAIKVLLPVAIVVIAGYIIYRLVTGRR